MKDLVPKRVHVEMKVLKYKPLCAWVYNYDVYSAYITLMVQ